MTEGHANKDSITGKLKFSPLKYNRKRFITSSGGSNNFPYRRPSSPLEVALQNNSSLLANQILKETHDQNKPLTPSKKMQNKNTHKTSSTKEQAELDLLNKVISNRYLIQKKIGSGSFGTVFRGYDLTRKCHVSIKSEKLPNDKSKSSNQLGNECKAYNAIRSHYKQDMEDKKRKCCHMRSHYPFPIVYYYGRFKGYNVLVLELLGSNLEEVFNLVDRKFSTKTIFMLAIQFLNCLELLHSSGLVHRDIKPANFLLARPRNSRSTKKNAIPAVYCIDLGLCKYWRVNDKHIELRKTGSMSGTARYASLSNHKGFTQSRKDDLETLANTLVYFAKSKLPWMGLKRQGNIPAHEIIGEKKKSLTAEEICKGLDPEFLILYNYSRCLDFKEKPDYSFLYGVFRKGLVTKGLLNDQIYDWQKFNFTKYLSRPLPPKDSCIKAESFMEKVESFSLGFQNIFLKHCRDSSKKRGTRLASEMNPRVSLPKPINSKENFTYMSIDGETENNTKFSRVDSLDVLVDANSRNSVFDMNQKLKDYKDVKICTEVDDRLKENFTNETINTQLDEEKSEFLKSLTPSSSGGSGDEKLEILKKKFNKKQSKKGCINKKCIIL